MRIFNWLFRRTPTFSLKPSGPSPEQVAAKSITRLVLPSVKPYAPSAKPTERAIDWDISEAGNKTITIGLKRLTVFSSDRGWKYAIAEGTQDDDVHYSEPFETERQALEEVEALLQGKPSRHMSITEARRIDKSGVWRKVVEERTALMQSIEADLRNTNHDKIGPLRKHEAKLTSHIKQLDWQPIQYFASGMSEAEVAAAEALRPMMQILLREVEGRISTIQAAKPLKDPKPRITDSCLSNDHKKMVDDLTAYVGGTKVVSSEKMKRLEKKARAAVMDGMRQSLSWGQSIGFPVDFADDQNEHRENMKLWNQDLTWQVKTTRALFDLHLRYGEYPAPHYPNRILVLLRKAKDYDREREFVCAWRRHFPREWVEHATKIGAVE